MLPRHSNIAAEKVFNLLDEHADRCVHLFPQLEECTYSFRGKDKMYTCDSIANLQRTPVEINKFGAIAKVRVLVEQGRTSNTEMYLNSFRITSNKISLLTIF